MAGLEQEPSHMWATRRTVVAASVAVVLILALALWLTSRVTSHPGNQRAAGSAAQPSTAATPSVVRTDPRYFSAPLKRLRALSKADAAGRIALPWNVLKADNADARVEIVFASRSCEHIDGIDVEQAPTSVAINVLASNIPGIPSCDVVPELHRAVVALSAPLKARPLVHAPIDKTYWPTNPFDQP
jgi:hypothetical protein